MKNSNILTLAFLLGALWICAHGQLPEQYRTVHAGLFSFAQTIPSGQYNYRSAQLSLAELDTMLASGKIHTVIRLNGNGKDAGGVSIRKEAELCRRYEVDFYHINIHKGNMASNLVEAARLLDEGHALVHCRHGYDRTGAVVGYWLRQRGFSARQVIQHNGWAKYLEKKGRGYLVYYSAIQ